MSVIPYRRIPVRKSYIIYPGNQNGELKPARSVVGAQFMPTNEFLYKVMQSKLALNLYWDSVSRKSKDHGKSAARAPHA